MRILSYLILSISIILSCSNQTINASSVPKGEQLIAKSESSFDSTRYSEILPLQVERINQYIRQSRQVFSKQLAICIDMKIPSNFKRFFIVNLQTGEILSKGLCAHGSGSEIPGTDSLQFSNTSNSYMTSLGLYRIGNAYNGNFGKSYKLHGLESTNDKAFERYVVLHRYMCVPDEEQRYPICTSLGCPMLSENYMEEVIRYLDKESKPVIMNIYF